jgi:hypothetical protein
MNSIDREEGRMSQAVSVCVIIMVMSGLMAFGVGVLLAPNCLGGSGEQTVKEPVSNRLAGVKGFPLDYDSGSMAVHALRSCLQTYDLDYTYSHLMGISGAIYKFVYDSTEAYEPLRDIYPYDLLQIACGQVGFPDAHWETGQPIEVVKEIVKREIDAGHPLLAPFLKPDAYHGFFIITGYDYEKDVFYLQGAFEESTEVAVPIPDGWDGPTASPAGWASNPVFVIGDLAREGTGAVQDYGYAVELGISIMKGGRLSYGNHPGEHVYLRGPGPHEASYGLEAYGPLASDVETKELTVEINGEKHFNFGLIWRIDAQIGQLEHDRRHGAQVLRFLARGISAKRTLMLREITRSFNLVVRDARDLRRIFWCEIPDTLVSSDMIADYARTSPSIVFRLPDHEDLPVLLERSGHDIYKTVWGWVLIDDSDAKRLSARLLVRSILSRERSSARMLEDLAECVDLRPDPDWSKQRRGPRKRE